MYSCPPPHPVGLLATPLAPYAGYARTALDGIPVVSQIIICTDIQIPAGILVRTARRQTLSRIERLVMTCSLL